MSSLMSFDPRTCATKALDRSLRSSSATATSNRMFPGPKPVLPNAPVTIAASTVGATNAITSAERSRRRWRRSLRATKSATRTGSVPEGLAREVQEDRLEIGFDHLDARHVHAA